MTNNQRVLEIDGALNFRDLGGYTSNDGRSVRWGAMFRCGQLDRLSQAGIDTLRELGIKTVIDLRFTDEIDLYPSKREAFPDADFITWHDEFEEDLGDRSTAMKRSWKEGLESKDPQQVREAMRLNYPQKLYTHRAIYRRMLQRLSEGDTPLVFHCAAGKDRTGVAAALILSLLGVSEEQIIDDYLLTQQLLAGKLQKWFAGGAVNSDDYQSFQSRLSGQPKELLEPIFDADVNYIKTLLQYIHETYQGFANYAENKLELAPATIEQLRDRLLV